MILRAKEGQNVEYEDVSKQAGELWQSNGAKAAVQFIASTVANETGELRGRLLGLLGDYQVEGGNFEGASGSYVDALELFVTPEYRFTVLACAMGACVHTRRFKQGMRYAVEADGIRSNHSVSNRWLGVYHMNSGRLAMLATDYSASVEDFTASARYFRADGKCEQEALNAEVYLAEVLMNIGKLEESLSLCRKVRVKVTSDVVKFNLDVLQG
jgi:tetratricopeptide (TPR) repeat protein